MTRRRLTAAVLTLAIALAVAGCGGGVRSSLGTSASPCFRALPLAENALHDEGRLIGVRRVKTSELKGRLKDSPKLQGVPNQELCVFAFRGNFQPGKVDGATNPKPGQYAIVAVTSKRPAVVAAFVVDKLPTRFAHLH